MTAAGPGLRLRRPVHPRPGRLRPAGHRGLARRALRRPAAAHPRDRRDLPQGLAPRAARAPGQEVHDPAAGRPGHRAGQAAQADQHPGPRADPGACWPRWARRTSSWPPRSPRGGSRSSSPGAGGRVWGDVAGRGPGQARPGAGRARGRRRRPGGHRRGRRRTCSTPCGRGWRCTSAAWAPGARTSTTTSPAATATRPRPRTIQDLYLDGQQGRGRGRGARRAGAGGVADRPGGLRRRADRRLRRGRGHHASTCSRWTTAARAGCAPWRPCAGCDR